MTQFENWGDYFWPGQIDDCKINKLGIHDATELENAEPTPTPRSTRAGRGRARRIKVDPRLKEARKRG